MEFVVMHCVRRGCQVAMKLDAERNIVSQWIVPDAALKLLDPVLVSSDNRFVDNSQIPGPQRGRAVRPLLALCGSLPTQFGGYALPNVYHWRRTRCRKY